MTKPFSRSSAEPDEDSAHDALLAEAFRHHAPPAARKDRGDTDPTVGSLDLAERNAFRRVIRDTEIRSEDHLSLIHI